MTSPIQDLARQLGIRESELGLALMIAGIGIVVGLAVALFWGRGPSGR